MIVLKQFSENQKDSFLEKAKKDLKFRAKRAKYRYKDSMDFYNNKEAIEENRKVYENWAKNSRRRSGSNDSRQTIYHKNGMGPETIKDPEKYAFKKEETRRLEDRDQRMAEKALKRYEKDTKHPRLASLRDSISSLGERTYSETRKKYNKEVKSRKNSEGLDVVNESKARKKTAIGVGVSGALTGEVLGVMHSANMNAKMDPEDKKLFKKLLQDAKKRGVSLIEEDSPIGPAYNKKLDAVVGLKEEKHADVLSHELGHRHFAKEKGAKKLGSISNKSYLNSGGTLVNAHIVPFGSGIVAGHIAGKNKARKEKAGEKESFVNKHAGWAIPVLASAPMLVAEASASKYGIKSLKSAGASKKYLKSAKKRLGTAFGTYATRPIVGAAVGQAVKEAAYIKEKKKLDKEK